MMMIRTLPYLALLLAAALVVAGCGDEATEADTDDGKADTTAKDDHDHDHDSGETAEYRVDLANETCPSSGGPVDKEVFAVHNGYKIYFDCTGCRAGFVANPESLYDNIKEITGVDIREPAPAEEDQEQAN